MRSTTELRKLMAGPGIIQCPGVYDCMTAKLAEHAGFEAVYMTGAGTSAARLGYPDLALTTMTEMVSNAADIVNSVSLPVIADADTGYGGVLNVARTVRYYERSGVAALHIEDQEFPKRCGHLEDKRVIPAADMVSKVRAAVGARSDPDFIIIARTDALAVTGWDDTMRRCQSYVEAGADVLFVEAIRTSDQAKQVINNFDVPILYNFVETGKSPLLTSDELERLGFKLVIYPCSAMLAVSKTVTRVFQELKKEGTTAHLIDEMADLKDFFDLLGLSDMLTLDSSYAN
ncbi:carboxyvinyl-carboxyphosphonate phosphorylmutase [SAR202 cluster bacterium AD-804-J14_MRT_500m]|nr:carboxyvinyl-carboxyphosphonate phosphorylmutase [SAR202 cluster bacterium AD-804-J14_MRT_500m]